MPPRDRLDRYRARRDPGATPEPFGEAGAYRPGLFVVQQHAARRLHYDLRLEIGGTLRSWAIPGGFSRDPAVKRLAVQTEDHPLDYADFEGIVPAGEYGAGAMIVWDRGRWRPVPPYDEPERCEAEGKLLFDLEGLKLRGRWTLVRTRGRDWLLMKKPDAWSDPDAPPWPTGSVLSGLAVDELAAAGERLAAEEELLAGSALPPWRDDPAAVPVMLAERREHPFSAEGWRFELKYDGYRMLAARRGGRPYLRYRRPGREVTDRYPEIARAVAALPGPDLLLDGEVVVLDDAGRPEFQRLQRRAQLTRWTDVDRATVDHPATLYAFDLLALGDRDLRGLPLSERKRLLARIVPRLGVVRLADDLPVAGEALFAEVRRLGLEGIVAKRETAPYRGERSADWLKIPVDLRETFFVIGWSPESSRAGAAGSLHLARDRDGELVYAGRVAASLPAPERQALEGRLRELALGESPAVDAPDLEPGGRWVAPRIRVEVRYKEQTREGQLRQPSLLAVATDEATEVSAPPQVAPVPVLPERGRFRGTRLDKVFWPDEGFTKRDLLRYYESIAPWLLPYLKDRPVVLDRYPDGVAGKSFYQKNAPEHLPEWIRTVPVWSEEGQRSIRYVVCDDVETLLHLANLGTVPLHVMAGRVDDLDRPDWCLIDFDPKEAPFADVVTLARALHALCAEIGLPAYPKTSGSSGLHVLIPLGRQTTMDQSRSLGQLLAGRLVALHPRIATTARTLAARGGRVYVDVLQNRRGQLVVAPYSLRPLPGAPASAPLRWSEVKPGLHPRRWDLGSLPRRMRSLREDPMAPVLRETPDLLGALERLAAGLDGES